VGAPATARLKFTLEGGVQGGQWNCGLWASYSGAVVVDPTALGSYALAVLGILNNVFLPALKPFMDPRTSVQQLRVDTYASGSAAVSQTGIATTVPIVGTGAAGGPATQALALSLYSATPSRSGRGRIYLPATATLTNAAGAQSFAGPLITTLATSAGVDFSSVNGTPGPDGAGTVRLGVFSNKESVIRPIVQVLADTRPDRIEHREKFSTFFRDDAPVLAS